MIVTNEESTLGRCLESVAGVFDDPDIRTNIGVLEELVGAQDG